MKSLIAATFFALALCARGAAGELPERIDPPAPFPLILEQAPTFEDVAPGIEYAYYRLRTQAGPLEVRVVSIAPHPGEVRVGSVLAGDGLDSRGETVGAMAHRTGAVAGINGDYFDIGNTNRPENLVVREGALLSLPSKRYALAITRDGTSHIAEFSFTGEIAVGDRTLALDGLNQMPPPHGGVSLLTPAYGRVAPAENVTLISLAPIEGTPPFARYRVTGIADNLSAQAPGYYAAVGLSDYGLIDVPNVNDIVSASGDLSPVGLESIETAIGGGPLILHDGEWFEDPNGPSGGEFAKRIPCSGAAVASGGRLLLIEVDGRQPEVSVGLRRPEFAALMRALGATEGMALDGGGSSTLVVRRIGDANADVANSPSDRIERPVGDALLAYSTLPYGPPVRYVARPGIVRALAGAQVPLRFAGVDAANHVTAAAQPSAIVSPGSLGTIQGGTFVALHPGSGRIVLRSGAIAGEVPVEVVATPARVQILPDRPNVDRGGSLALTARAYDSRGYPLDLPQTLAWSTGGGSIDARGFYRAGPHDARVDLRIGGAAASAFVTVGSHEVALPFAQSAHFVAIPSGGQGGLIKNLQCRGCVELRFSFGAGERAAYAMSDLALPAGTIGMAFELRDDGSAARLRVAVRNAINEDVLLDATKLGEPGWRNVTLRFPPGTDAARLVAIYALASKGIELSEGSVVIRNVRAVVAGE